MRLGKGGQPVFARPHDENSRSRWKSSYEKAGEVLASKHSIKETKYA